MHKPSMLDIVNKACEIAEMDPDHIYSAGAAARCVYVAVPETGTEACLFGQAYAAYGIPDDLMDMAAPVHMLHEDLSRRGLVKPALINETNVARIGQSLQDSGDRWGQVATRMRDMMARWE